MSFSRDQCIHFIGIGGAGMSAIAKVLLERGVAVSGSDLKPSRASNVLEAMGATIFVGHSAQQVAGADAVVASTAIPATNPELQEARERSITVMTRGEALAALLQDSDAVAVAGTHGKTTTTSMIVTVLRSAGIDPTYLVGAGLNDSGTNAKLGTSSIAVAESDESDGSFLLLSPHVAVITNIELDHVDHWGSLDALYEAFFTFIGRTDPSGALVLPHDNERLRAGVPAEGPRLLTFGTEGDVVYSDVRPEGVGSAFSLTAGDTVSVTLSVPGAHNVANATAAAAACISLGVSLEDVASGLALYRGVERRFQVRGEASGVTVVDDYAHHPTEVAATLAAARPGPWRRIVAIFQPHRYSRTAALAGEFGDSFGLADKVILMDVYGAGEDPVPGVSGKLIADAVNDAYPGRSIAYFPHRAELLSYLEASSKSGDLVLTLGAGDVTTVGDQVLETLRSR
jgi:UDP-N-acetylmuramate--alanine ligase